MVLSDDDRHCISCYHRLFDDVYFTIDYGLSKEVLMLLFLRSFGYVIIAICFITALTCAVSELLKQSVQAFVSASFWWSTRCGRSRASLECGDEEEYDVAGQCTGCSSSTGKPHPFRATIRILQQQALMVSMKELYGWLTLISLFCLMLFWISACSSAPCLASQIPGDTSLYQAELRLLNDRGIYTFIFIYSSRFPVLRYAHRAHRYLFLPLKLIRFKNVCLWLLLSDSVSMVFCNIPFYNSSDSGYLSYYPFTARWMRWLCSF